MRFRPERAVLPPPRIGPDAQPFQGRATRRLLDQGSPVAGATLRFFAQRLWRIRTQKASCRELNRYRKSFEADSSRLKLEVASHNQLRPLGLETFSFACAKTLIDRHPDWLPFVEPVEKPVDGVLVRLLAINLPSANPSVLEPLRVVVDLGKIVTASWFPMNGESRWNYDWIMYMHPTLYKKNWPGEEHGFDIIAEWIERFTSEQIVAIWSQNDERGNGSFGAVEADDVRTGNYRRGKKRTTIRSWRGSLDLDLVGPG
jgi:hypothetical protein